MGSQGLNFGIMKNTARDIDIAPVVVMEGTESVLYCAQAWTQGIRHLVRLIGEDYKEHRLFENKEGQYLYGEKIVIRTCV